MSWEKQIEDLARLKQQEFNEIDKKRKWRSDVNVKMRAVCSPIIEKIADKLGGYIHKNSEDWWSLYLVKKDGSYTTYYVEIFMGFPTYIEGRIILKLRHTVDGDVPGYHESIIVFSPSGQIQLNKKELTEKIAESTVKCVKGIRF